MNNIDISTEDLFFKRKCHEAAIKCGLREVDKEEIDERVKLSDIEYNKLLKEVDER